MASSRVREWNDASGAHTELLRPDGSWKQWTNGIVVGESGPDPGRAEAFAAGQYDVVAESIRYGNDFLASPYGQRLVEQEERAGQRARELSDRDYGLRSDELGFRRDESDRRFGLEEDRFGLEEQRFGLDERRFGLTETETNRRFGLDERSQAAREMELDRRFGLDSARLGVDFFKTAADYGKTPRSWLDSLQFENPAFLSQYSQGLQNPAFGARGAVNPGMASITDAVASTGGTLNKGLADPASNIKKILAGAPPSETAGMSPKDIAAVNLIQKMYAEGAQKLPEGTIESWDPDELAFNQGVMDYISPGGGDRFVRGYRASRIPTRSNPFSAV